MFLAPFRRVESTAIVSHVVLDIEIPDVGFEVGSKWVRSGFEVGSKWVRSGFEVGSKWAKNSSKILRQRERPLRAWRRTQAAGRDVEGAELLVTLNLV